MKITHDFHIHTHLSVCAKDSATVEHYRDTAKELGLKKLGFADHFWDETCGEPWNNFYLRQGLEHVLELKKEIAAVDFGDVKTYFGCETEYDPRRQSAAITPAVAEQFDFIIVPNSHTHMMMPKDFYQPYEKHKQFMIDAYNHIIDSDVSRYILSMAHPFEAVCCPYDNKILMKMMTDDEYKYLFDRTAEKGIAIEINVSGKCSQSEQEIVESEPFRLYRIAKDCGCKFTFGSDSHNSSEHNNYDNTCNLFAEKLGLGENDFPELVK